MSKWFIFIISTALLNVVTALNTQAQIINSVSIGYGTQTNHQIIHRINDVLEPLAKIFKTTKTIKYTGVVFASYLHAITSDIEVGGGIAFEQARKKLIATKEEEGAINVISGGDHVNMYTCLATAKFNYINSYDQLKLYSSVSIGATYVDKMVYYDELGGTTKGYSSLTELAYQANAIGFSYNFSDEGGLGVFMNIGYGCEGIVNAGLSYNF